ncbi:HECTD1 [Bugula neritina]|uniref:E3 ubiquitin-protein ligase n=1 Tax=Bugula neritina TaxID=10212 RepID=A0A7J7KPT9_BUGNE|nr:HECTD1 [Bugula neritina]
MNLLESFANLASRNFGCNNKSQTTASTLLRALSSNRASTESLLSAAQSFPNLNNSGRGTGNNPSSTGQRQSNVLSLSQTMALSLTNSSDSEADFLESCHAQALLEGIEDEQPECVEEEDEEDDEDDEDEMNLEDDMYNELMDEEEGHNSDCHRRSWDDDFVLKRQFSALVPAFDPRPGRTNVNQTQDFDVPPPGEQKSVRDGQSECEQGEPRLSLSIRGPSYPGMSDIEVPLDDPNSTIFKYVQTLSLMGPLNGRMERLKRIWDPTYTLIYRDVDTPPSQPKRQENTAGRWTMGYVAHYIGSDTLPKTELIDYLKSNAEEDFLARWRLSGTSKNVKKTRNCSQLMAAYKDFLKTYGPRLAEQQKLQDESLSRRRVLSDLDTPYHSDVCSVDDVLRLLQFLYVISLETNDEAAFAVQPEKFVSKKLTNKITQQLNDCLVLASMALPDWCERLTKWCPMLFSYDLRSLYYNYTAYGTSRAIISLQNRREQTQERGGGTRVSRREDSVEYRVGRLKHERVKVPRGDKLLPWAMQVMKFHAERKSVLEIEFVEEEGTGLGPTLEFYALVSAELQKTAHAMWVTDDSEHTSAERAVDIGHGVKQPGYYIQRQGGLFPAPYPQSQVGKVTDLFRFLGCLLAKALQDGRLVDVPLSRPFLRLMCMGEVGSNLTRHHDIERRNHSADVITPVNSDSCSSEEEDTTPTEKTSAPTSPRLKVTADSDSSCSLTPSSWFTSILTDADFQLVYPTRANFLQQLKKLADDKATILADLTLNDMEKTRKLDKLKVATVSGEEFSLQDLCLSFTFNPSSTVYGYEEVELVPGGAETMVDIHNVEEYIQLVTDFCMHSGIQSQLDAFTDGFNSVFPMEKLHSFSPSELVVMLCGEQCPQWTREDIMQYTEPKLGFTKDSPGFLKLVNVLVDMNADERKAFLQFTTGCSSLPPGGLANLHPRLTIVKKSDSTDCTYPSVNTCVHYLKLPDYSSEEVLRQRLSHATIEKGFHLN